MEKNKIKIGSRFGRLIVTAYSNKDKTGKHNKWLCQCDCGNEKIVYQGELKKGKTKSCGCLRKEITRNNSLKHGFNVGRKHGTFYGIWANMKQRCTNKKNPAYKHYGGRGIKIEDAWLDFINFKNDMYSSYLKFIKTNKSPSIERKNVNKGYNKENCKWIPLYDQCKNQRKTRIFWAIESNGKKYLAKNMSEFARKYDLSAESIRMCLKGKQKTHFGWTFKPCFLFKLESS